MTDTLASRYEVEVEPPVVGNQSWVSVVSLVTAATWYQIAVFFRSDKQEARDAAYQFLKDRPR